MVAALFMLALPAHSALAKAPGGPQAPAESIAAIQPLLIGQKVPEKLILQDIEGRPFDLNEAMGKKQTVLIFYRGGWCPYCNVQLGQLHRGEEHRNKLGYQMSAISPDSPEELKDTVEKHELGYTILSDPGYKSMQAMGVSYKVTEKDFGSKRKWEQAQSRHKKAGVKGPIQLPVPSVYLVSRSGRVFFNYVNVDIRVRLSAEVLLTAAQVYAQP